VTFQEAILEEQTPSSSHDVNFLSSNTLKELPPLPQLSKKGSSRHSGDSDDLDQFKSIVVRDDMREGFFEALDDSPLGQK
jgi:hypothetical protein